MIGLLALKEKVVGFYKNYEYFVNIVAKLILALLAFTYINKEFGYLEALTGIVPTVGLSVLCAIAPTSVFVLIFMLVAALHLYKLSAMLALVAVIVFLLFYFIYLKFAPEQGILIILYAVLSQYNLHYMVPLIGAMTFNPFAAVPMAFGVVFIKVLETIKDASILGNPGTDVQEIVTSYQYIFDKLLSDKELLAYIIVFTVVIVVVYAISRLSVDYVWYIAIAVGTVINIIGLSVMVSGVQGLSIGMVVIGSILGGLLAMLIQFAGVTLDYARKEYLQFEDDDYYYYVKAIPKLQLAPKEHKEKRIVKKKEALKKMKKSKKDTHKEVEKREETPKVSQDTRTFEPVKPEMTAPKKKASEDFDDLSFDGFDFDDLD